MTVTYAIALILVNIGSCWACYRIGILEEKKRCIEKNRRRREARWVKCDQEDDL